MKVKSQTQKFRYLQDVKQRPEAKRTPSESLKEESRDIKISNYLVPQNLVDAQNHVYTNLTMHNKDTRCLVETLNRNEPIR